MYYDLLRGVFMKLNYKRTILVGFAFFLIMAFWQAYDNLIPLTLTNKFGMSQAWSGVIMALDNILAVVLLPLFGAMSDKHRGKHGKRSPFILVGTVLAVITIITLGFVDNMQLKNIREVSKVDDPAALTQIYESQGSKTLATPDNEKFVLEEKFTLEQFTAIRSELPDGQANPQYTAYVAPAQQAHIWQLTQQTPTVLYIFIGVLLAVLVSMSIFRSPAVALMPDVTPKPMRSKGNAVVNLMGTAGGILVLILGKIFATSAVKNSFMSYIPFFGVVGGIMLISLVIFLVTVKEPKWAAEMQAQEIPETDTPVVSTDRKLSRGEKSSLILILASVALWYLGYNAITSKYSVYANRVLHMDYNMTLLLAQGAAIVTYLPVGMLASRLGRKKTILAGVLMLGTAFGVASGLDANSSPVVINAMFILAGIGWATINVNSFPMVVELCSGSDIGKYTGYYYTASMAAQAITPWISGYFMDTLGMRVLFPYATIFVALAFVTMLLVTHGDSKAAPKKGLEAFHTDD